MAGELAREASLEEPVHLTLLLQVRGPQLLVVDRTERRERLRPAHVDPERHSGRSLHEPADGPAEPGGNVDPVRDADDRVAGQVLPGLGSSPRVELADGIRSRRVAEHEGRHVEGRVRVVGVAAAELEQLCRLHVRRAEPSVQRPRDELAPEDLVAGGDRRVDREDGVAPHPPKRLAGGEPRLGSHELAGPLDEQEGRVPLVQMPDRRLDAERTQGANAADAEDQLLAEAHLPPADVQDVGDRPIRWIIGRNVRVEEEDRSPPDLRHPYRGVHGAVGDLHAHLERRPVACAGATHRQLGGIEIGLGVLLVPIGVDLLTEVAAAVEEADADERERGIRRRLAVVARQDAEPTRVELHRLVDAELGAEVGDRTGQGALRRARVPGVRAVGHVPAELVEEPAGVDHEILVGCQLRPACLIGVAEDGDRVAVARPGADVDAAEQ